MHRGHAVFYILDLLGCVVGWAAHSPSLICLVVVLHVAPAPPKRILHVLLVPVWVSSGCSGFLWEIQRCAVRICCRWCVALMARIGVKSLSMRYLHLTPHLQWYTLDHCDPGWIHITEKAKIINSALLDCDHIWTFRVFTGDLYCQVAIFFFSPHGLYAPIKI